MFKPAERKKVKLKIALTGPSGAGKTLSALYIAQGIGSKIALADTENGTASLYADKVQFDGDDLAPPYTVDKYVAAIKGAEAGGYDVLVIDSLTHAWAGEGGILDQKEKLDARGGNSFVNWGKLTPQQQLLVSTILNANIHIICTMRSKQEYALNQDGAKTKVQKLGMAPIQREGMEYEFTLVLDIAMNHSAQASKDRTGLFDGQTFTPSDKTGKTLMAWLAGSSPEPKTETKIKPITTATEAVIDGIKKVAESQARAQMAIAPQDEAFEVGKEIKGKLFSVMISDKGFLSWVNDELSKNYAKTHDQIKRFHKYCRYHGAYTGA